MAGAEGFEPSPSSLTVRCPTSWTTPQRALPAPAWPGSRNRDQVGSAAIGAAEGVNKIPRRYRAGRLRKIYAQQTKSFTWRLFPSSNASSDLYKRIFRSIERINNLLHPNRRKIHRCLCGEVAFRKVLVETIAFTITRARTSRLKTWEAPTSVPFCFAPPT